MGLFSRNKEKQTSDSELYPKNLLNRIFNGYNFNSWFYFDSIEDAEEKGYPFSNACFQLDGNILIAHGTSEDETPRDFIYNNQSHEFIIDKSILPLNHQGKVVYYVKKREDSTDVNIDKLAKQAYRYIENENVTDARQALTQIYQLIKSDPSLLNEVKDSYTLGSSFLMMLDYNLFEDIYTLKMISSVGYYCFTKAMKLNINSENACKNRLLLLRYGQKPLKSVVISALDLIGDGGLAAITPRAQNAPILARDLIYNMEIYDLGSNPKLCKQFPLFKERKEELDSMVNGRIFSIEKNFADIKDKGKQCHEKLYEYIHNKLILEQDTDF